MTKKKEEKGSEIMETNLTHTVYIKHTFIDKEIIDLSHKMASAEATINRKMEELKSVTTTIKADIAIQEGILHSNAEKLRSGYEMRPIEANVKYDKGIVTYFNKESGEVYEERPMTPDEQLRLTGKAIDAEEIIREDNEDE
jgi:hypothetical protein